MGLIPFIARLCIFIVLAKKDLYILFDPIDFVILGLVVNITNINELEGKIEIEKEWKTKCIGISIIFIIIYAIFFALSVICSIDKSILDKTSILLASIALAISSIIFGYSIFDRLNKAELKGVYDE